MKIKLKNLTFKKTEVVSQEKLGNKEKITNAHLAVVQKEGNL